MNFLLPRPGVRALCAAALLSPLAALAADLSLNVAGGPATEATLYVALYDSAAAFAGGKSLAAQTVPLRAGAAQLRFNGLAPGRYALRVFADENGNGKLDTNLVGMPIERYGFSNDAKGNRGAPDFEAAALNVESADLQTAIQLR
ncbi:uncharacterized protein (DUF2141 family) [Variovorax paradoxus]|jgi:uncharacterized protein (DUF2141 family)|uniref:DUF2141 domain-containing protein n=1 Tax=Variovorax paradoxus TaxID=34073 RepID=UPI00278FECBB|nr:DUF2141 domain-containing protein [Variovorax paradoxus]MDQ0568864.1 uncharacterized protein (DUF2141 family) [Variovorax paradoxus]